MVTKTYKMCISQICEGLFKTSSYGMQVVGGRALKSFSKNLRSGNYYDTFHTQRYTWDNELNKLGISIQLSYQNIQ